MFWSTQILSRGSWKSTCLHHWLVIHLLISRSSMDCSLMPWTLFVWENLIADARISTKWSRELKILSELNHIKIVLNWSSHLKRLIVRSTFPRLWMHKVAISFQLTTRQCSIRFKMSSPNTEISFEKRCKSTSEKVVSWGSTLQRPRMSTTNTFSNRRRQLARRWIRWVARMVFTTPEFQTSSYIKCFTLMIWYLIKVTQ